MVMVAGKVRLIGDIGGTNARLAIAIDGQYQRQNTYLTEQHPGLDSAIAAFVQTLPQDLQPQEAALAIAAPLHGDRIQLTNNGWCFSRAELAQQFGFSRLLVLNDFTANALALPYLGAAETEQVGGGVARAGAPIGILGPGTGLGVSGLVQSADGQLIALAGEGGHVTMPPAEPGDAAILAELARRLDHVSAERVLSGEGLVNLYEAQCALDKRPAARLTPAEITDAASDDPLRHATVARFCAMLGTIAGNLALTLGAEGGIYIAGGIVPRLGPRFARSEFRRRFEAKGRMQPYLARIPTYVITHPDPALIGLARLPDA
jgi:glucokinase